MHRIKLFLLLLLIIGPLTLNAQNDEVKVGLRAGHNAVFGGFAAVSLETIQTFCDNFSLNGGLQYNTIGKTTLEATPSYNIPFDWGKLSVESLITYTSIRSINNITAGAGISVVSRSVSGRLGYYYRIFCGEGSKISEPFNIYYELRAHLLKISRTGILT